MKKALIKFVKEMHGDQKRKYINTPYWEHPIAVAELVSYHSDDYTNIEEVALCHDLFEDTQCTWEDLFKALRRFRYSIHNSVAICNHVKELTDVYTKENYFHWNRKQRKRAEADRLATISPLAQTVKYADLIDNTESIVEYDPKFAKVYLSEKEEILSKMKSGHPDMYFTCLNTLKNSMKKIAEQP